MRARKDRATGDGAAQDGVVGSNGAEIATYTLPAQAALAEHADAIRSIGRRVIADAVEIGRRLTEAKALAGHGAWLTWLHHEFGWTARTARNFIRVHATFGKTENFSHLALRVAGLYLLAAPSTPEEARDEVIGRAQAGETISVAETRRVIHHARSGRAQPSGKPPPKPPTVTKPTRDDIGAASSAEVERLRSRIEELHQQIALRDQRIAALERQVAESERRIRELARQFPAAPADDSFGIPGFLRRTQ